MSTEHQTHNGGTAHTIDQATLNASISVGRVQRFLDAIRTISNEFELAITPEGVTGTVVNTEQTMMGTVHLDASTFEHYEATTGEVGIQTDRLREVTRMTSNRDTMHLTVDEANQTLTVEAGSVECSLQMDDGVQVPDVSGLDDADHPSVCVLEGGELKRIMKAAGHVATQVDFRIEHTRERFVAEATGDSDRLVAPREDDDIVELLVGAVPVASTFNLDYLRQLRRAMHKRTEVTLALGTDSSLSVAFDIADGAGRVEYSVAPVIANDDDESDG